jgi:plasmid stability protein
MPANPLTTQFTVRNVPLPVSRYLRRRANSTGKSVNAIIVEELTRTAGLANQQPKRSVAKAAESLFGVGFDPEAARILDEDDKIQKELTRKRWAEEA